MARNGSGTFNRTDGTDSGATLWQLADAAGRTMLASAFDTHDQDVANALTASICNDGQTPIAANLTMSGYRHTNVDSANARTDYARADDVQDSKLTWLGASSGSSNTYTTTASPTITAYAAGQRFHFKANHTNTGSATINIDSVGAKTLKRPDGTTNLSAGDLVSGQVYEIIYESTIATFIVLNPSDTTLDDIAGLTPTDGGIIVGDGSNFVLETGSTARASLGLAIGTDVQAYDADLAAIAALAKTDGGIIVGNGSTFVLETGSTARASLGLAIGTDVQAYDADLAAIAALAKTDGNFIVGNGSTWITEAGSTVRASLGLTIGTDVAAAGSNGDITALTNCTSITENSDITIGTNIDSDVIFQTLGANKVILNQNNLTPASSKGSNLGTSSLPWNGLNVDTINYVQTTAGSAGSAEGYLVIQVNGVQKKIQYLADS